MLAQLTAAPCATPNLAAAPCATLAGSSFGGICTLWACMHYPGRFGAALVESPSLWFADERFLK